MVKKIFECWITPDKTNITFTTSENIKQLKKQGLIQPEAYLQYYIEANTVEEACAIHHLRQGWGADRLMGEPELCPQCNSWFYPQGSGECWQCGNEKRNNHPS